MNRIKFSAPMEPVPFKRVASNGKRRFNPPRYSDFKNALGLIARRAMNGKAPFTGAIKLTVNIFRKYQTTARIFGDGDNHFKAVADALNGICYLDDKQIICGIFHKFTGEPHLEIELEEV